MRRDLLVARRKWCAYIRRSYSQFRRKFMDCVREDMDCVREDMPPSLFLHILPRLTVTLPPSFYTAPKYYSSTLVPLL
jgi:hypothetical protein